MAEEQTTHETGKQSWSEAWMTGPGPGSWREAGVLWLKGFCMGTSDIIPGVSGGTIAFITGIYGQLLAAIASIDLQAIKRAVTFDLKGALARVHLRFLLALMLGIGIAIVSTARLMHFLLAHHPVPTWSLFFGLIAGSILFVGKRIDRWAVGGPFLVAGAVGAFFLVGMIPRNTPETWWFVFISGMIAICAMILPGISGSFILLILGKYMYVTGAVKNPFAGESLAILGVFGLGAGVGIAGFSRLLKWLLARYECATMAVLTGFMLGAMRKIWPWQEAVRTAVIDGKEKVLETELVLPGAVDGEFFLAVGLAVAGFCAVFALERISRARES